MSKDSCFLDRKRRFLELNKYSWRRKKTETGIQKWFSNFGISCAKQTAQPQISLVGLSSYYLKINARRRKARKEKSNLGELVENFYFPSHNATKSDVSRFRLYFKTKLKLFFFYNQMRCKRIKKKLIDRNVLRDWHMNKKWRKLDEKNAEWMFVAVGVSDRGRWEISSSWDWRLQIWRGVWSN